MIPRLVPEIEGGYPERDGGEGAEGEEGEEEEEVLALEYPSSWMQLAKYQFCNKDSKFRPKSCPKTMFCATRLQL